MSRVFSVGQKLTSWSSRTGLTYTSIRTKIYPTPSKVRLASEYERISGSWHFIFRCLCFKVEFIQGKSAVGKPAAYEPTRIDIEKGKSYSWCSCGASKKQVGIWTLLYTCQIQLGPNIFVVLSHFATVHTSKSTASWRKAKTSSRLWDSRAKSPRACCFACANRRRIVHFVMAPILNSKRISTSNTRSNQTIC